MRPRGWVEGLSGEQEGVVPVKESSGSGSRLEQVGKQEGSRGGGGQTKVMGGLDWKDREGQAGSATSSHTFLHGAPLAFEG